MTIKHALVVGWFIGTVMASLFYLVTGATIQSEWESTARQSVHALQLSQTALYECKATLP